MEKKCDVLIVGGGPAGLTAASFLSQRGLKTIILEKKSKIGDINKKLDITEGNRIEKILHELNIKPNKISSISEWKSKKETYVLDSEIKDFYFIRGNGEDSIEYKLLKTLNKDNVEFLFNSEIENIDMDGSEISTVTSNNIQIKPKQVIIATGKKVNAERQIGIKSSSIAKFTGLGVIFNSKKEKIKHTKVFFDQIVAPGGYVYVGTVHSETYVCVVIDHKFSKNVNLKDNLQTFVQKNFGKVKIKNYFSGFGISGTKETQKGNTFFIGGSAFFHDSFLGYGLNYAIESGYYAAKAIQENNIKLFNKYTSQIHHEIKSNNIARNIWREADNSFFDDLIMTLNRKKEDYDKKIGKIIGLLSDK